MGKRSTVQPLFRLVRQARSAGGIVFFAPLLLLGCSGSLESPGDGRAGYSGADGGSVGSSGGSATTSRGGDEATGGAAGRASGGAGDSPSGGAAGRASGSAGGRPSGGAGGRTGGGIIISGAGRAGALGRAGSSGGGSVTGAALGIACTNDAQCGNGMVCITAESGAFGGAGPSKGMCTIPCTDPGECSALKAGAVCVDLGTVDEPQPYCLDSCEQGDPLDLNSKCAGRTDFACANLGDAVTVIPICVPHCRSDAECGSGLFCDKRSLLGLCSTTPHAGDPVGTPCTPGATPGTCAGICIRTSATGVTPVTGSCIEYCSAGFECMYGSGSNPSPGGFCGGQFNNNLDFGAFDLGYCLGNCSCTSDCELPGDLCRKWPDADADLASALGAPGVCYPMVAQSVELTCAKGGAGGGGGTPP